MRDLHDGRASECGRKCELEQQSAWPPQGREASASWNIQPSCPVLEFEPEIQNSHALTAQAAQITSIRASLRCSDELEVFEWIGARSSHIKYGQRPRE